MDFDRDGTFDSEEIIITDLSVSDGTQSLFFTVPTWAVSGESWARFRISNTSGIDLVVVYHRVRLRIILSTLPKVAYRPRSTH